MAKETAAMTVASQRVACGWGETAREAMVVSELVMVLLSGIGVGEHQPFGGDQPDVKFPGSPLPIAGRSAISAAFIARLIKGCRGDDPCGQFSFGKA